MEGSTTNGYGFSWDLDSRVDGWTKADLGMTGGLVLEGVPRFEIGARLEGQFFPLLTS